MRHLVILAAILNSAPQPFGLSALAALRDADVQVIVTCVPDGLPLRIGVRMSDAKPTGQYLQVAITNTSDREVALTQLTARIPYPRPTDKNALIATGAWDMGRTQTRVWPAATTEKLESGTFVASHTDIEDTLAGFVTWRTFNTKLLWQPDALLVTADGEGRLLKPNETVWMEKLWLASASASGNAGVPPADEGRPAPRPDRDKGRSAGRTPSAGETPALPANPGGSSAATTAWQDLFFAYADRIAEENHIHLNPVKPYIGWGTWDYYGFGWNHDIVRANRDALLEIAPHANLIQIDAGWNGPRGDHLRANDKLGKDGLGMQRIAQLASAKNLDAGTYFCPMRDNPNVAISLAHPEYFLKNAAGKILASDGQTNGKNRVNIYYDYSNPATCAYIKHLIENSRAWGFTYYKTDFLRDGINEHIQKNFTAGPRAPIVPHDRSLTSVERYHRGMAAMREGMGADSYFLACSAIFGPSFGHADALRAGDDISPKYRSYKKCATDNTGSFYLHEKVIHIDTDYIVVRAAEDQDATRTDSKGKDGTGLTLNEAQMWAHLVALCSSTRISSDALPILRPERRALFAFAAAFPAPERFIPLDFWQHARDKLDPPSLILATAKGDSYLGVFNWSDDTKRLTLAGLPAAQLAALATLSGDVTITKNISAPVAITPARQRPIENQVSSEATGSTSKIENSTTLTLKPRHSAILKIPAADFDTLRHAITLK